MVWQLSSSCIVVVVVVYSLWRKQKQIAHRDRILQTIVVSPGVTGTSAYWEMPEEPLLSPKEPPDSSWLVNEREDELKDDEASDVRIDREPVDEEDGENDMGSNPYSLK